MTRRRVIFVDVNGKRYISPEYNGDKNEYELFYGIDNTGDYCDKNWEEIFELFKQCSNYNEFIKANVVAQSYYHSQFGNEILVCNRLRINSILPQADKILYVYGTKQNYER